NYVDASGIECIRNSVNGKWNWQIQMPDQFYKDQLSPFNARCIAKRSALCRAAPIPPIPAGKETDAPFLSTDNTLACDTFFKIGDAPGVVDKAVCNKTSVGDYKW
ncbi:hypothetical protein PFISCL1PPCAC_7154, partial [Pristionchus fissidentatus]